MADGWIPCRECYYCEQGDCADSDRYDGCEFGLRLEEEEEEDNG